VIEDITDEPTNNVQNHPQSNPSAVTALSLNTLITHRTTFNEIFEKLNEAS